MIKHFYTYMGIMFALVFLSPGAYAACSNPVAQAGAIIYNTTNSMLQFCNGTDWVNTASSGSGGAESDPQVGTVNTSGKWCRSDGSVVQCDQDAPSGGGAETDPQVGAVTLNKWCMGDGDSVECNQDAPSAGAETDPEVGAVTNNMWCRGNASGVIVCDQTTPTGSSAGTWCGLATRANTTSCGSGSGFSSVATCEGVSIASSCPSGYTIRTVQTGSFNSGGDLGYNCLRTCTKN